MIAAQMCENYQSNRDILYKCFRPKTRGTLILAFVANEALSIIENAGLMGVPMPAVITKAVDMLQQDKDNKKQA